MTVTYTGPQHDQLRAELDSLRAQVRWFDAKKRRYGRLEGGTNPDGSLIVIQAPTGNIRNLTPDRLETLTYGPRGGTRWTPYRTAQ